MNSGIKDPSEHVARLVESDDIDSLLNLLNNNETYIILVDRITEAEAERKINENNENGDGNIDGYGDINNAGDGTIININGNENENDENDFAVNDEDRERV